MPLHIGGFSQVFESYTAFYVRFDQVRDCTEIQYRCRSDQRVISVKAFFTWVPNRAGRQETFPGMLNFGRGAGEKLGG
jgi:hypothetical protein